MKLSKILTTALSFVMLMAPGMVGGASESTDAISGDTYGVQIDHDSSETIRMIKAAISSYHYEYLEKYMPASVFSRLGWFIESLESDGLLTHYGIDAMIAILDKNYPTERKIGKKANRSLREDLQEIRDYLEVNDYE